MIVELELLQIIFIIFNLENLIKITYFINLETN